MTQSKCHKGQHSLHDWTPLPHRCPASASPVHPGFSVFISMTSLRQRRPLLLVLLVTSQDCWQCQNRDSQPRSASQLLEDITVPSVSLIVCSSCQQMREGNQPRRRGQKRSQDNARRSQDTAWRTGGMARHLDNGRGLEGHVLVWVTRGGGEDTL